MNIFRSIADKLPKIEKPHRVIIVIMVFVLLIGRFIYNKNNQAFEDAGVPASTPVVVEEKLPEKPSPRSMGITTFFHTAPLIGQLKVFSDWEGKYRTKEEGNKISFLYLNGVPGSEPEIFSIAYYSEKDWASISGESAGKAILVQDGTVFVLVENQDFPGENAGDDMEKMADDIDEIVATFKVIRLEGE